MILVRRSSLSSGLFVVVIAALATIRCGGTANLGDETHFEKCVVDEDCRNAGPSFVCELGVCRSSSNIVAAPSAPAPNASASPATAAPPPVGRLDAGRASSPVHDAGPPRSRDAQVVVLHPDAGTPKHNAGASPNDAGEPKTDAGTKKDASPPGGVLAETDGEIQAVAMDDRTIYFSSDNGLLRSVAKDGSGSVELVTSTAPFVEGIAVDDSFVYFTDLVGGTINRLPKAGGDLQVVAMGQTRPWGIVVDGTRIYWANQGVDFAGSPNDGAAIMALSKEGGDPVTLAANQQMSTAIALDGAGGVVWLNGPNGGTNGSIRYLANGQTTPKVLASGLDFTSSPVVTQGRVVWLNGSSQNTLSSVALTGGSIMTALHFAAVDGWTPQVAVDPPGPPTPTTWVYYGASAAGANNGSVGQVFIQGGAPHQLAGPVSPPPNLMVGNKVVALLVDANNVYAFDYWATTGEHGRIRAIPK
jgi:hypothetical protein